MINNTLEREEKAYLLGIEAVFNFNMCEGFECPRGGCVKCPINAITIKQEELCNEIRKVVCS